MSGGCDQDSRRAGLGVAGRVGKEFQAREQPAKVGRREAALGPVPPLGHLETSREVGLL
jgi:hypothetical protein